MREQTTRLEGMPQQAQQPVARRVSSQVAQAQTDSVPNYIPQMNDPDVAGLINGLSAIHPSLMKYAEDQAQKDTEAATLDAVAGRGKQKDTPTYTSAYFSTDGMVKAQADGMALKARYETEFDKDKGDLEKWLAENYQGRLKNIDDEHYISGYTRGILPALQDIRKAHVAYQQGAVVERVESNVQQMAINAVTQYLSTPGAPDVSSIQAAPGEYSTDTWGKRPDGSAKGTGYLGVLKRPDGGVSTEISTGVNLEGKDMEIPTLVPTLTRKEVDTLLALPEGQPIPEPILTKAVDFARKRMAEGKDVFAGQGEQTPPQINYIHELQAKVGKTLGVSDQRFQELLFNAVKIKGDEGNFDAFNILKQPRPDGSPGLAFDPKWTEKIEQAQLHSFTVSTTRAETEKKQLYNKYLYDVFAEDDPVKSQAMFKEMKQKGLFRGDAEGLLKWEKLLTEKVDGKPDVTQLENEGKLLSKIYKGSMGYEDILRQEADHSITSSQRKYLLGEIRKVSVENRQLAAQEGKASEQIYKSKHFTFGMDYIEESLKPRAGLMDKPDPFEYQNLADARREFVELAQGKKPEELRDIADAVVKRGQARRKEASSGGMSPEQRKATVMGGLPYRSLPELIDAKKKNLISNEDYLRYRPFLREQHGG